MSQTECAGWFADRDTLTEMQRSPWRPYVETREGTFASLDVWFDSEADCLAWIEANLVGLGLHEDTDE